MSYKSACGKRIVSPQIACLQCARVASQSDYSAGMRNNRFPAMGKSTALAGKIIYTCEMVSGKGGAVING